MNYICGKESRYAVIKPAEKRKNVIIVGGGLAGIEAARVAALRGHQVTIYEKNNKLGGLLFTASRPDFKDDQKKLLDYYITQLKKVAVTVKLGTEVNVEAVKKLKPDVVVVAVGSEPIIPDIPGIKGDTVVSSIDVLENKVKVGENVIVAGGGLVGCETALFLAEQKKDVTIVEMLSDVAIDYEPATKIVMMQLLADKNVKIKTQTALTEVTDSGAYVFETTKFTRGFIKADNIVLALGQKPNKKVADTFIGNFREVYVIGDCVKIGKYIDAIHVGARTGFLI